MDFKINVGKAVPHTHYVTFKIELWINYKQYLSFIMIKLFSDGHNYIPSNYIYLEKIS